MRISTYANLNVEAKARCHNHTTLHCQNAFTDYYDSYSHPHLPLLVFNRRVWPQASVTVSKLSLTFTKIKLCIELAYHTWSIAWRFSFLLCAIFIFPIPILILLTLISWLVICLILVLFLA